ncbi:MAG: hypothetical protein ACOX52_06825 [Verrucomicrobiota bacterium]
MDPTHPHGRVENATAPLREASDSGWKTRFAPNVRDQNVHNTAPARRPVVIEPFPPFPLTRTGEPTRTRPLNSRVTSIHRPRAIMF